MSGPPGDGEDLSQQRCSGGPQPAPSSSPTKAAQSPPRLEVQQLDVTTVIAKCPQCPGTTPFQFSQDRHKSNGLCQVQP